MSSPLFVISPWASFRLDLSKMEHGTKRKAFPFIF